VSEAVTAFRADTRNGTDADTGGRLLTLIITAVLTPSNTKFWYVMFDAVPTKLGSDLITTA
jgi:hypothetical protein